jgi:glycosyltransferase involved in cell wall biosynthesis
MLNEPIISIITVCYNSEYFVSDTIQSVLNQTYTAFEYIIIDDHSSDSSWNIINSFNDFRIKTYRNEKNLGEYANRNKAVELASGEYIIFIDGDDYMYHNALETFFYYIQQFPECAMIFTREWDPRILYPFKADPETLYRFEFLDSGLMGGNFTKVLFKKEALEDAGYLPMNIITGDTYIQLKIALTQSGVAINDGLTWWRMRTGNATDKFFKSKRYFAEVINYQIGFLNDPACPLSDGEKHIAKNNVYGNYLRSLFRMLVNFELKDLKYLLSKIKIPFAYYKSILIRPQVNYFDKYNGDNPLHTLVTNK